MCAMRMVALMMLVACTAPPPAPELVVIAHQDDDLLFMQHDLFEVVRAGGPLTVVYVTAGDGGNGPEYVEARNRAARAAYGMVAGSQDWTCVDNRCSLGATTLVFLGHPDGGLDGDYPGSLLLTWQAGGAADVIGEVTALIEETRPSTIRTLEIAGTHGYDHSDHMMVGALTQLALARSSVHAELFAYRGYNINDEPANLDNVEETSLFMRAYNACMVSCGSCGVTPCETIDDPWYDGFLHRRYVVGMRDEVAGSLRSAGGYVGDVEIDGDGLVHLGDRCLEVDATNRVNDGDCEPAPNRFFQLDEEGHLWSGVRASRDATKLDHTPCVVVDGGALVVETCGADRDYRWMLAP